MKEIFLEKILEAKRERISAAKAEISSGALIARAMDAAAKRKPHRLRTAMSGRSRINVIAEFKRASPSKGNIHEAADAAAVARSYESGGAAAISVLTEQDFFKGSLVDLRTVRKAVDIPILRKDFFIDEYQIYEAAEAGADAILLIAAILDDRNLHELHYLAETTLGLDALVEVHTLEELERAKLLGPKIIGVNNRDLKSFNVTLDVSREMIRHRPEGSIMLAESGLKTADDLAELLEAGYSGFLIGETLMRSGDPEKELRKLLAVGGELHDLLV